MNKKNYIPLISSVFIVITMIIVLLIIFNQNVNVHIPSENYDDNKVENLNLPTSGNDYVIKTKSQTTLRVINEYTDAFFTKEKNLLIMFGSWCPNCKEEINETQKIIEYFKDNKEVEIILIAHEYEDTVNDLIDLVENKVNFGDVEVKIDLGRIIRKTIDPDASTVPISYLVDKKGRILYKLDESISLKKAIEITE